MKNLTLEEYQAFLEDRFGGALQGGRNLPGGKACILESYAEAQGMDWTDDPKTLRIWDLRQLNDMPVDPKLRARHIAPVLIAYQGSMDWPIEKQKEVASRLAVLIVNRIISKIPTLPDEIRKKCLSAKTLQEAEAAATAACMASCTMAFMAATAAADAAATAAAVVAAAEACTTATVCTAGGAAARVGMAATRAGSAASRVAGAEGKKFFILICQIYLDAIGKLKEKSC